MPEFREIPIRLMDAIQSSPPMKCRFRLYMPTWGYTLLSFLCAGALGAGISLWWWLWVSR